MVALLGGLWSGGGACSPFFLGVITTSGTRARYLGGQLHYVPL